MSKNGEIYTAGKNFTLPPAVTAWTDSTSAIHHFHSTSALIQRRSIFRSSNSTARGLHGREHLALLGDSVVVEVFCSKTLNHPSPILTLFNA